MTIQTKNKILKSHGIGLVELIYECAKSNLIIEGTTFMGNLKSSLNHRIEYLEEEHSEKDRKKIIETMAKAFLEKGQVEFAYNLYKKSNPKKARLIKKILPYELIDEE